jgi:hypothetical protein
MSAELHERHVRFHIIRVVERYGNESGNVWKRMVRRVVIRILFAVGIRYRDLHTESDTNHETVEDSLRLSPPRDRCFGACRRRTL